MVEMVGREFYGGIVKPNRTELNTKFVSEENKVLLESFLEAHPELFDLKKLDSRKSYVGLMYGDSYMAKLIRKFSKEYCPNAKVPNHVFALSSQDGDWFVYQSWGHPNKELHISSGVNKTKVKDWMYISENHGKKCELYEFPVVQEKLNKYIGTSYGRGDILNLLKASLTKSNGKQANAKGMMCSEYVAACMDEICDFFKLQSWCITPAHIKDFMIKKHIRPL